MVVSWPIKAMSVASFLLISLFAFSGCDFLDILLTPAHNPLLDEDCKPIEGTFDEGWQEYSVFDPTIPTASQSVEAQAYHAQAAEIAQLSADVFILKRDYEIVNEAIGELQQYRVQLAAGHKANLIKTTVRMAYITYQAMDSAHGTGKLYSEFLAEGAESGVQAVGKAIKLGRAVTPANSRIAINTESVEGKVANVASTGWVETMASLGDPKEVAQEMLQATKDQVMPGAELSDKELAILRLEYLELKKVDQLIQRSNQENFNRLWEIRAKEARIGVLKDALWELETREKALVKRDLVSECKMAKRLSEKK